MTEIRDLQFVPKYVLLRVRQRRLPVRVSAVATCATQITDPKWRSNVLLDTIEDGREASVIPLAVRRRIKDLEHSIDPVIFCIQHFNLLLESTVLLTSPAIVGIPKSSPIWMVVHSIFLTVYFAQLKTHGDPFLSYVEQVRVTKPTTLQLQSKSLEKQAFFVDGPVPVSHF